MFVQISLLHNKTSYEIKNQQKYIYQNIAETTSHCSTNHGF